MLFVYVDDILALSHQAESVIKEIAQFFKTKESSIKPHKIYLGTNTSRLQLPDGHEVWVTFPQTYVKNSIKVIKKLLDKDSNSYALKSKVSNPFPTGYKPEVVLQMNLILTLPPISCNLSAFSIGPLKLVILTFTLRSPCFPNTNAILILAILKWFTITSPTSNITLTWDILLLIQRRPTSMNLFLFTMLIGRSSMAMSKRNYHPICLSRGDTR